MEKRRRLRPRQIFVPLVLTVTVIAGAAALTSTTTGCDDNPPVDAGVGDGLIDTPII